MPRKKSEKQLAQEKSDRIMNGIADWCAFYRENPQRFVKDYLNVHLKKFQKILIYEMMHENYFMYVASRGQGKTFLIALFCVIRCILFPKTKICVASATRGQANEVLSKIVDDFMKNYTWGSENLRREISYQTIGTNKAVIKFYNGSWIKVVTASDSGRSNRANILVCDEFWMMDSGTITSVLKKFLTAPRSPGYLNDEKYSHMQERNKEMYAGSAWMKSHWSYAKARSYTASMLDDKRKYFVCGLPYQLAMYEGLLSREQIQDEMSESDFDEVKFETEMGALFYGSSDDAFFKFDDIDNCRRLKNAIYPESVGGNKKAFKVPDLVLNERRILSVDIALMASSKRRKNDAASIIINSALPTTNNEYVANIVYLDNKEGFVTSDLALEIRKLFDQYKCTDLVIDASGRLMPLLLVTVIIMRAELSKKAEMLT